MTGGLAIFQEFIVVTGCDLENDEENIFVYSCNQQLDHRLATKFPVVSRIMMMNLRLVNKSNIFCWCFWGEFHVHPTMLKNALETITCSHSTWRRWSQFIVYDKSNSRKPKTSIAILIDARRSAYTNCFHIRPVWFPLNSLRSIIIQVALEPFRTEVHGLEETNIFRSLNVLSWNGFVISECLWSLIAPQPL